jgi:DNA-binding MarR family transcriptional regulator
MERKHDYFAHAARANLTGEQARVFLCLLSEEHDGEIWIKQSEVAERLDITDSNVSRSIKALKKAGLISQTDADCFWQTKSKQVH